MGKRKFDQRFQRFPMTSRVSKNLSPWAKQESGQSIREVITLGAEGGNKITVRSIESLFGGLELLRRGPNAGVNSDNRFLFSFQGSGGPRLTGRRLKPQLQVTGSRLWPTGRPRLTFETWSRRHVARAAGLKRKWIIDLFIYLLFLIFGVKIWFIFEKYTAELWGTVSQLEKLEALN